MYTKVKIAWAANARHITCRRQVTDLRLKELTAEIKKLLTKKRALLEVLVVKGEI